MVIASVTKLRVKQLIHPVDFREAWGLSTVKAAEALSITTVAMYRYTCNDKSKTRTSPSDAIKRIAALQSEVWIMRGRLPVKPDLIFA